MTTLDLLIHLARSIPEGVAVLTSGETIASGLGRMLLVVLACSVAAILTPERAS